VNTKIVVAGAGIGGLATALSLEATGLREVEVLEATDAIRQIGVGVNLPPHAVRELTELGLGEALADIGIPTSELAYYDRQGRLIWAEPRGLAAGYRWPQYSIHRGRLQDILYTAVCDRLGARTVRTGQRVTGFKETVGGVRVATRASDRSAAHCDARLLIAADGIRSAVRAQLYPGQRLATNGWMMYRGATRGKPFLSGTSMVIIGDEHLRVVLYPIERGVNNWLLVRPAAPGVADDLGNWNRRVDPQDIALHVRDWRFDWLDVPSTVAGADIAWEYPMADFDPLPRWVFGRTALLGDAAHAMYPFGSNGASQAIIDARVLAHMLASHPDLDAALAAYQAERLPVASAVQLANRRQANDVMARVGALVRDNAHASAQAELKEVEARYKRLAGFDAETLNTRPSWDAPAR
jgi:2-polyprenyl-6-methoxyphenol hydroxylase-like FAD-dependent oxidoreductase